MIRKTLTDFKIFFMIKKFSKKIIASPFFWIFVITISLLWTILITPGTPHHGDLTYPTNIELYQGALYPLWNEHTSVPNFESVDRGFSLFIVLFTRLIGGNVDLLSKIYFFLPLLLSGFTCAFLVRFVLEKTFPNNRTNTFAIVAASFLYMISPWVLEEIQAPFYWFAYAVTPGIILLAYRFFSEKRLVFGVGLALLWSIAATTPHYAIFSFLVILVTSLLIFKTDLTFNIFKNKVIALMHNSRKISFLEHNKGVLYGTRARVMGRDIGYCLKTNLRLWGFLLILFLALNAYWVVAILNSLSYGPIMPGYVFTKGMLDMFSGNTLRLLSGTDQWTTWWPLAIKFDKLAWGATIALLFTLCIAVFLVIKKRLNSRLFFITVLLWLLGVFFALGHPINPIYNWLATEAPLNEYYGWLLRVPGKISYILWPAYTIAMGIVLQFAIINLTKKKLLRLSMKIVTILSIVCLLIAANGYAITKAQDYFNYYYAPVQVPIAYQQAFSYIQNNLTGARVADMAEYEVGANKNNLNLDPNATNDTSFESSYTWNPHRIAGYLVPRSIPVPAIGYYHFTYSTIWRPAYERLMNSTYDYGAETLQGVSARAADWLPVYGANYLLYHDDIVGVSSEQKTIDIKLLLNSNFTKINEFADNDGDCYIYLFKARESFGRIYALNASYDYNEWTPPSSVNVNSSGVTINEIKQVDATLWQLNVTATNNFKLIFTEGYDAYWTATVQDNSGSVEISSQKAYGSINSFNINQTGELHITLQYQPQIWVENGAIISILLLGVVITGCLLYYFKKHPLYIRCLHALKDI
jgi:hypothetical protein